MPPIMGAGGFLMAEMTEIPYVDIMKMAIFPAIMYFLSVFVMIHFEAKRYGLYGEVDPEAPTALDILMKEWFLVTPLVLIIVTDADGQVGRLLGRGRHPELRGGQLVHAGPQDGLAANPRRP